MVLHKHPTFPLPAMGLESIMQFSSPRGLIRVQGEAYPLQYPVRNVLRGEEIGFKNQANSHGIPSHGGGVDRCPKGFLQGQAYELPPWVEGSPQYQKGVQRALLEGVAEALHGNSPLT